MAQEQNKGDCPFTGHGEELVNVKFFRGRRDDVIGADEIKDEARKAVMQHRMGIAAVSKEAPRSAHPVINVGEFVANL